MKEKTTQSNVLPNYNYPPMDLGFTLVSVLIGFIAGFAICFIFYKLVWASVIGGIILGIANIYVRRNSAVKKRKYTLRTQFLDMLEALSVSLRAGNPMSKALESAKEDLLLIYQEDSDVIVEVNAILNKFKSAIPLADSFSDWAERSGLEDIASFATVYKTIEGKSTRANEIVRETQRIIADKAAIELEMETMMTAAKNEVNIMLVLPLVILVIIGYMGSGFMDALYTTPLGRLVATGGLIVFLLAFALSRKFLNVKL